MSKESKSKINEALTASIENGHESIVKLLIKAGADVNHIALITAVENGKYSCAKLIIEEAIVHKDEFGVSLVCPTFDGCWS